MAEWCRLTCSELPVADSSPASSSPSAIHEVQILTRLGHQLAPDLEKPLRLSGLQFFHP